MNLQGCSRELPAETMAEATATAGTFHSFDASHARDKLRQILRRTSAALRRRGRVRVVIPEVAVEPLEVPTDHIHAKLRLV